MVDNNFGMHKPLKISSANPVQNDRTQGQNNVRPPNFEPVRSKNPCHDGCRVKPEQVEAKAAEPAPTQQNAETQKVSGNCPGGNLIANILQELLTALQDVKIGR